MFCQQHVVLPCPGALLILEWLSEYPKVGWNVAGSDPDWSEMQKTQTNPQPTGFKAELDKFMKSIT